MANVSLPTFDVDGARQYLAGLESLAREAQASGDPRVTLAALQVLARQGTTVGALLSDATEGGR